MGFGITRAEARQLVGHNAVLVNGSKVNIASFQVKPGDEIMVRERCRGQLRIKSALEIAEQLGFVPWVDVDSKAFKGVLKAVPDRAELSQEIDESLVVALYSK
jgi:small subunit ribosomal protein S4